MGIMKNIKGRDPIVRLQKKESKIRAKLNSDKPGESLKELVTLADEFEKNGKKTHAVKLRNEVAGIHVEKGKFKAAHPLYHQIAQVYMDHSKFEKAAEYYKLEAMAALKAKAIKEYQLAIFLGCLSRLVVGDLESAEN